MSKFVNFLLKNKILHSYSYSGLSNNLNSAFFSRLETQTLDSFRLLISIIFLDPQIYYWNLYIQNRGHENIFKISLYHSLSYMLENMHYALCIACSLVVLKSNIWCITNPASSSPQVFYYIWVDDWVGLTNIIKVN